MEMEVERINKVGDKKFYHCKVERDGKISYMGLEEKYLTILETRVEQSGSSEVS